MEQKTLKYSCRYNRKYFCVMSGEFICRACLCGEKCRNYRRKTWPPNHQEAYSCATVWLKWWNRPAESLDLGEVRMYYSPVLLSVRAARKGGENFLFEHCHPLSSPRETVLISWKPTQMCHGLDDGSRVADECSPGWVNQHITMAAGCRAGGLRSDVWELSKTPFKLLQTQVPSAKRHELQWPVCGRIQADPVHRHLGRV